MRSVVPTQATLSLRHADPTRGTARPTLFNGLGDRDVTPFATTRRPSGRSAVAPDGSDVRVLLGLTGGGMAEFELRAGRDNNVGLGSRGAVGDEAERGRRPPAPRAAN